MQWEQLRDGSRVLAVLHLVGRIIEGTSTLPSQLVDSSRVADWIRHGTSIVGRSLATLGTRSRVASIGRNLDASPEARGRAVDSGPIVIDLRTGLTTGTVRRIHASAERQLHAAMHTSRGLRAIRRLRRHLGRWRLLLLATVLSWGATVAVWVTASDSVALVAVPTVVIGLLVGVRVSTTLR